MKSVKIVISLFFIWNLNITAQLDNIIIRRVSPQGGYSFKSIHGITQDDFGYIWMASYDGILRYNSRDVKRFMNVPFDSLGLPSNRITKLIVDKNNNVWAGSGKGLAKYNRRKQVFERVRYVYENGEVASNYIQSMTVDDNGYLWLVDRSNMGVFDPSSNTLIRITDGLKSKPSLIYKGEANNLWVGCEDGAVYVVKPNDQRVTKIIEGAGSTVISIYANQQEVWVGYLEHGANAYFLKDNQQVDHPFEFDKKQQLKNGFVRKIYKDTRQRVWIATYTGLYLYHNAQLYHFNPQEYTELPHNSIFEVYEDKQGGLWIGTWAGGVAYIHHSDNKFTNFQSSRIPNSLSNNMVSSFTEDFDHNLYVGTEGGGLNLLDRKSGKFSVVNIPTDKKYLNIKALQIDKHGGLWVGTAFSGLFYKPKGSSYFKPFKMGNEDGLHVSSTGVYALCASDSGMWIGTSTNGINFYNSRTKKIEFKTDEKPYSLFRNQAIRSLTIDSHGNLWAGTLSGLFRVKLSNKTLTYFNPGTKKKHQLKTNAIYFVKELSENKIWIGTSNDGIKIYDYNTDSVQGFFLDDLLKGKDVYGILESNKNIWITTNNGLLAYNRSTKKARSFIYIDGIQGNLFNPNAVFKDSRNSLYFGGTNGFSMFQSGNIELNTRPPVTVINKIEINNKDTIPFQIDNHHFDEMELNAEENTLKFHFSADNYLLPEKNKFKYRLTNYVDNWIENNQEATATFVNVPAGKYTFEVLACNNDGVWNTDPTTLPISIKQFWYKSRTAMLFYILTVFLIIAIYVRIYFGRSALKKKLLIQNIQQKHSEELNEMKLKFFTNISHEFRTPLTLISLPIKNLLLANNLLPEQVDQLETVKKNTNRLLQLINQIMDIRKVEKGKEKLNVGKIEIAHFVQDKMQNFNEEARFKRIDFSIENKIDQLTIEADEEKLDKIIFNLLSNAFKHTPIKGNITITIEKQPIQKNHNMYNNYLSFGQLDTPNYIEIAISDDGGGIDSEDLSVIFNRFERAKQKTSTGNSSGIGLNICKEFTLLHNGIITVQSTLEKGTRFAIKLPIRQSTHKIIYESHQEVKNLSSWSDTNNLTSTRVNEEEVSSKTILIVEDNNDLRNYIANQIKKYYKIQTAQNGALAMDVIKKQNIDLIISDVMMPVMDGFEFCQKVKSQLETSHIPVILLTALSSSSNTSTGLEKGADAYIPKPFDEEQLLAQIRNLIQQRKRLHDSFSKKFISNEPVDVGNLDNYFLNKVTRIIEENIENEAFSVEKLAEEIALSRSQLHRKIKQISNKTTSEYIMMVKIKKATILLASKNYTIDEVSYKTGFNSHSYFTKCFKKIHKVSPKDYVKKLS